MRNEAVMIVVLGILLIGMGACAAFFEPTKEERAETLARALVEEMEHEEEVCRRYRDITGKKECPYKRIYSQ